MYLVPLYTHTISFLLKKREQTLLLLFSRRRRSRPSFFFSITTHQNTPLIDACAGTQHTQRERKNSICTQNFQVQICDQNFSNFLQFSSRHNSPRVKENERNGQDYQKYALFVPFLRLFFSPSLSLSFVPMLRFLRVRILSLSPFALRLCVRLCACLCVSESGLIFVSEFCFHLNHKFSSRALSRTDFVSSLYHLASSFNSVCCIGAGYVGGPTMAMIALKCPHIEVMNIFL